MKAYLISFILTAITLSCFSQTILSGKYEIQDAGLSGNQTNVLTIRSLNSSPNTSTALRFLNRNSSEPITSLSGNLELISKKYTGGNPFGYNSSVFIIKSNVTDASGSSMVERLSIDQNGTVRIGVDHTFSTQQSGQTIANTKLAVAGTIRAEEVIVHLKNNWPDYVFSENYVLLPLSDVEKFIQKNHHLPNIPSATEVATSGNNLGEMDALLLRKIEELTLYMIQLKKDNEELAVAVSQLKK
jgi:hypothetical protein